ncbi:hypothetical protein JFL47_00635 [Haemophilus haemoglobinophilus]|nr:hypothetical protein [Canicola haemoglobinophilus]
MKKSILFLSLTPFLLAGCGDTELEKVQKAYQDYKNYENNYYTEHRQSYRGTAEEKIEILKEKLKLCEKANDLIYEYRNNGAEGAKTREDIFPHFSVNRECDWVQEKIESIKQSAAEEKEKREKEDKSKQEFISYIKSTIKQYDNLTWQQVIEKIAPQMRNEYIWRSRRFINFDYNHHNLSQIPTVSYEKLEERALERYWSPRGNISEDKKQKAILDFNIQEYVYVKNAHKGLSEIIKQTYEQISNDNSFCKNDRREYSICSVWRTALNAKSEEVIAAYTKNFAKLKQDFNQCLATWTEQNQRNNEEQKERFWSTYPCYQAKKAVEQLNFSTSNSLN